MGETLLIGEFARRCRLPVSTLRYYDRIGLLTPAAVDASTGYRRYRVDQLPTAELIARLRVLGVGPAQIAAIVVGGDGAVAALVRERHRVSAALEADRRRLHALDELLADGTPGDYVVEIRHLISRQVAVQDYSAAFDEQEPVVIRAIGALRTQLRQTGHTRAGAWGGTFPLDLEDRVDGYVFTEVHGDGNGLTLVELPGGPAVSTTHRGGLTTLSLAYLALFAEIDRLGATPRAPVIEEYVSRSELRVSILLSPHIARAGGGCGD